MIIKYYINKSALYKDKLIRISSFSEAGKALLTNLKRYGYNIDKIIVNKLSVYIPEMGITIMEITPDKE
ncbi:unnamed protein product [marine sediment metagenome]|uniref:Uncharacterized protein n=1 Tax=marine sediment metagenome TaxID=412755 RepID=X0UKK3_9ZZZZ